MKCVICHGDSIEKKSVKEECRIGNDVVYVPSKSLNAQIAENDTTIEKPKGIWKKFRKRSRQNMSDLKKLGKS